MKKYIDKTIINLFNFIFKKQELNHKKRMEMLNKKIISGKIGAQKYHISKGATLSIKNEKNKINIEKIEKLICENLDNPKKLFDFIKCAKTPIYQVKYASKILSFIGENEGLIYPKKGFKALYLNLILNKKIKFKTPEMFIFSSFSVNIYSFIYQFYNWYCYRAGLEGYQEDIQENFKHVFEICESDRINELDFSEILNLKSAIKRDIEAIEFTKKIVVNNSMAKKNHKKIKMGQAVNI